MQQTIESPEMSKIKSFAIKSAIIFMFIVVTVSFVSSEGGIDRLTKATKVVGVSEKSKAYLLGFVQNPASLLRMSIIDEQNGNIESAIFEMELSIGLLELHGANPLVMGRYKKRLQDLINKKIALATSAK
jgi:hypothetical protein